MNQNLAKLSSIKELMNKGLSIEEVMQHYENSFKKECGDNALVSLKEKLHEMKTIEGIVYLELPSIEDKWFADKYIEKMSMDGKCKLEYLIKVENPEKQHFYRGIRAKSVKLFANCGGRMSVERDFWESLSGTTVERARNIVFEDSDL